MLRELFESLSAQAVKAAGAQKLTSVDPRHEHYLMPDGSVMPLLVTPPLRKYAVGDLATIQQLFVDEWNDSDGCYPEAWINSTGVWLFLDRNDRRETAVYAFRHGDVFRELTARLVQRQEGFTQQSLVQFLRLKLGLPETIVARFRALQWSSGDDGSVTVQKGVDKLGQAIRREVINAAEIPDEIYVTLSVFDGAVEREFTPTIKLLVELDTAQRLIWLVPQPGEITRAIDATLASIEAWLRAGLDHLDEPHVYRGSPA